MIDRCPIIQPVGQCLNTSSGLMIAVSQAMQGSSIYRIVAHHRSTRQAATHLPIIPPTRTPSSALEIAVLEADWRQTSQVDYHGRIIQPANQSTSNHLTKPKPFVWARNCSALVAMATSNPFHDRVLFPFTPSIHPSVHAIHYSSFLPPRNSVKPYSHPSSPTMSLNEPTSQPTSQPLLIPDQFSHTPRLR